jgi:Fuc2NAc and GlcNAc transferase
MNAVEWPVLAPVIALVLALGLTPPVRRLLEARQWLDYPGERRAHGRPTPRGGGLAVLFGLVVALTLVTRAEPGIGPAVGFAIALGALGWLDDRYDLPVRWRLLVQLVISVAMVASVGGITEIRLGPWWITGAWLWNLLAVLGAVWLINLHNFMDGSDGLASTQGIWSGLAFGAVFAGSGHRAEALVAWCLAAAFAGFLVWNRPPARIFMGDTGSILLGGMVAWLTISGVASGALSVSLAAMICVVFVVDATATLLRRLIRGERWYTPHRQHAYQRLTRRGWHSGQVLALYASINVALVLPAVIVATVVPAGDLWLAVGLAGALTMAWWVVQSAVKGENQTHD